MINDTGLKQILSRMSGIAVGGEQPWQIKGMRVYRTGGGIYESNTNPPAAAWEGKGKYTFYWALSSTTYQTDLDSIKIYSPTGLDDKEVIDETLQDTPLSGALTSSPTPFNSPLRIFVKITFSEV